MRGVKFREETQKEKVGYLGIRVKPVEKGVKVMHIIDKTPASKEFSKLKVGDVLKSVNGQLVSPYINFYSLLLNTVDEKILLIIERKKRRRKL